MTNRRTTTATTTAKARKTARATTRDRVEDIIWRKPVTGEDTHYLVTWDMQDVEIGLLRLRDLLAACALGALDTPPVRQRSSLIRALREMAEHENAEPIYDDEEETTYALVRFVNGDKAKDTPGSARARVAQRMTVSLLKHPEPGQEPIVYGSPAERAVIEPILLRYQEAYTTRDITARVLSAGVYHAGGIKMREQGGFYFVPASGGHVVESLRTFVDMLAAETGNASLHMSTIAIADSGHTRSDMRYHGHKALVAELRTQQAHLRDLLRRDRVGDDDMSRVKPETAEGYMLETRVVAERAALYRDVADMGLRDLNAALGELHSAFAAVRNGLSVREFDATLGRVDRAVVAADEAGAHVVDVADPDDDDPFGFDGFDGFDGEAETPETAETAAQCPNGHALAARGMECPLCGAQTNVGVPVGVPDAPTDDPFAPEDDD